MLVANAFDAVSAEAVVEQRRALECFADCQLAGGIDFLEVVARGHGARAAAREGRARETVAFALDGLKRIRDGFTGHLIVPDAVAHLFKLVEDHDVLAGGLELPGFVENLFDVALAAGGCDDFARDGLEPIKALFAHLGGQDRDRLASQQCGVVRAATAIVAGARPNGLVVRRVKLTCHEARHEAAERCADLMAARGEPFAGEDDDARLNARKNGGNLDEVHAAKLAALFLGLVAPADAEQVQGVDVPEADVGQLFFDAVRNQVRVAHLGNLRDDDALLARSVDAVLKAFFVFRQVDHVFHS